MSPAKTEYDPEKAAELFGRKPDGRLERMESGKRMVSRAGFTLMYPASDSVRQALAADTANQLKEVGIEVKIEGVGWDDAYDRAQTEPLMWGWGAHTPMELYNIYHTMKDTGLAEYSPMPMTVWTGTWTKPWPAGIWRIPTSCGRRPSGTGPRE